MDELAQALGIELEYTNAEGTRIRISRATITALLAAFGFTVETDEDARECLRQINGRQRQRTVPPVLVIKETDQPVHIPIQIGSVSLQNSSWKLILEDGKTAAEGTLDISKTRGSLSKDADADQSEGTELALRINLPRGYHRFEIGDCCMSLIVVPQKCWMGPFERGQKLWGIAAQLYSLRTERDWGIGDFTDLAALIEMAAEWDAAIIGLNPLHALFIDDPEQASPYAPASRLHLNVLYIDVNAIPEAAGCEEVRSLLNSEPFASVLKELRAERAVNYRAVAELKLRALRVIHSYFETHAASERKQALLVSSVKAESA